ncbi:translocation and assembly module lipoprotein TamL [Salinimicrobium sp. TH3]|uniref:translocation and assembly module lipoprotein TamL n=1 Tax=Salinimicrobium sp. TH3 TaxID=2997342 RepID=UPI002275900E|nr:BamA/TamA family outer membrane protein [Salinimicrobium sp. TH3]MCY2686117.1 BamA/TamA family outer membrane protein [Salinimicrobium sp. TH3]
MRQFQAKISLILLIALFLSSCNAVKRVEDGQRLLTKNTIYVDGEEISTNTIYDQLYQEPNKTFLGLPIQLYLYNLANPNPDTTYLNWLQKKPKRAERLADILSEKQVVRLGNIYVNINEWIKNVGEPPAVVSEGLTQRSAERLKAWYWNNGWFNAETGYEIIPTKEKRAKVKYFVTPNEPYIVDSITPRIASIVADSIYEAHKQNSLIVPGMQYETQDYGAERERLTGLYRNNGLYHFEQESISFEADTINTDHKVNTALIIQNREATVDGVQTRIPYKVHKISTVNIFPDYRYENRNEPITDTASNEGYNLYSFDELQFKPGALTNAIFITPGTIYSDANRTLTYNRLNQLRTFRYPNIQYMEDPSDTTGNALIANIFLTPRQKYSLGFEFDISQSNIQKIGIGFGGSLLIRNVFRGAEILEIAGRGSIGSSKDAANDADRFFDITEVGVDVDLTLPRILFPIATERFIPKYMYPFTTLGIGASTQTNIGLDKQSLTAVMNYRWMPNDNLTHLMDLVNVQYVRNLNVDNYFNVYRNSYLELNEIATSEDISASEQFYTTNEQSERFLSIPEGADGFLRAARLGEVDGLSVNQDEILNDLRERKNRLTEDNLIYATNFSYILNKKENIYDEDFSRLRVKLEAAGNILSVASKLAGLDKDESGRYSIFGVNFSQYVKTEIDYIKHWDLGGENVFAIRTFGGIAVPYGNSNSIPFIRSFFAGGPNDNRAWQPYSLGPGSSGGRNEFNEANLKIALSAEYRFNFFGNLNGAIFADAGNIWNVFDVVEEEASTFTSLSDLEELALGTGVGFRYDFDFFVLRFDVGFKTYNPALEPGNRWFSGYNLSKAVFNVGINYPF